jgi:hypothetical protein
MDFDNKEDKGKCVEVEGSKFTKDQQQQAPMMDDDEEIIAPIEHAYYVIEGVFFGCF